MTGAISLLRHTLATIAYRGGKALRGATPEFANFRPADGIRTPAEILAHVGDLFDWAVELAAGRHVWRASPPRAWHMEVARFHAALAAFDRALANAGPETLDANALFQGPIADALTHIGQLAMLRRMAGIPIQPENYFKAVVQAGVVGAAQPDAVLEFD